MKKKNVSTWIKWKEKKELMHSIFRSFWNWSKNLGEKPKTTLIVKDPWSRKKLNIMKN